MKYAVVRRRKSGSFWAGRVNKDVFDAIIKGKPNKALLAYYLKLAPPCRPLHPMTRAELNFLDSHGVAIPACADRDATGALAIIASRPDNLNKLLDAMKQEESYNRLVWSVADAFAHMANYCYGDIVGIWSHQTERMPQPPWMAREYKDGCLYFLGDKLPDEQRDAAIEAVRKKVTRSKS